MSRKITWLIIALVLAFVVADFRPQATTHAKAQPLAIDLQTGAVKWEVPLGISLEFADIPEAAKWGSLNLGGSIVTAGGLVFIAAARDNVLRAFNSETGAELWQGTLPAGGQATPMTYEFNGKQYVVIAAGGQGRLPTKRGDYLVAFALP